MARVGEDARKWPDAALRARVASRISTSAAAPSAIDEELAAVTVPSLAKAAFKVGIFEISQLKGVSSRATTVSPLAALDGHGRDFGRKMLRLDGGE